jgi:hypothetical protein
MIRNHLAIHLPLKSAVINGCDTSALEVPKPFFAQGCISACGDALYISRARFRILLGPFLDLTFPIFSIRNVLTLFMTSAILSIDITWIYIDKFPLTFSLKSFPALLFILFKRFLLCMCYTSAFRVLRRCFTEYLLT